MFLTITIDTNQKKQNSVKFVSNKMNPKRGWKKASNVKKISLLQQIKSLFRSFKFKYYKLGKQIISY
jgi:hypothetical protein